MSEYGALDKTYHEGRKTKKSLIYRLNRRSAEVIRVIRTYYPGIPESVVDLGTADGLMLSIIQDNIPSVRCVGIEYSAELVEAGTDRRISLLQGDVTALPLTDHSFDIAIATAVIEHIPQPEQMLGEVRRVLRRGGLIILTSPDPFWEKIASIVGHLEDEQHCRVMNLRELNELFLASGFEILESKKFMLSPIGMPLEIPVEKVIRSLGLNFLFANQLIVGKQP